MSIFVLGRSGQDKSTFPEKTSRGLWWEIIPIICMHLVSSLTQKLIAKSSAKITFLFSSEDNIFVLFWDFCKEIREKTVTEFR